MGGGHSGPASRRQRGSRAQEGLGVEQTGGAEVAESRERVLLVHGKPKPVPKEVAHSREGHPGPGPANRQTGERQAGDPHPSAHVLFTPGHARRPGKGHPGTGGTPGPGHDPALHAPEPCGPRRGDSIVGDGNRHGPVGRGESMEAAGTEGSRAAEHLPDRRCSKPSECDGARSCKTSRAKRWRGSCGGN